MPLLARYIVRTVLAYTGLVLVVLLVLGALFLFIREQDDIGTGGYTAAQAASYVLMNMPAFACQMLPAAALIGSLLGLGLLARGSELVVMRASGVTTARLCLWLGVAGLVLAVIMAGLGEFVAPEMLKYARQMKVFSKYNEFSFSGNRGTWVRDGDTIISIGEQSGESRYGGIQIYRYTPGHDLQAVGRADYATIDKGNRWQLENYSETRFEGGGTVSTKTASESFRSSLSPDFLGLAVVEPEAMSLRDLVAFIDHQHRNSLDAGQFEVALWARTARFVALMLVVILALPFSLGPMRATGQGARMVVGILIGAVFVLMSQTFENSGQLLRISPLVTGWLPTALLGLFTFGMLARAR